jgi:hypothetical protein
VATRPSSVSRRTSEARIAVEATPGAQTDENLAWSSLKSLLQLHRIVASVKDEQGSDPLLLSLSPEAQKRFDLLGGHLVGVLRRAEALYVHGSAPALAHDN